MDPEEMERRREAALDALQEAIDQLGPITDETAYAIREPALEIIAAIEAAGKEVEALDFRVYDRGEGD